MNALDNANIADSDNSLGLASSAFPEAKSSQTGVSVRYVPSQDKEWYVLRILYGQTQQVADFMIENNLYPYVAMIWKDKLKDGKRKRMLVPFMNLLFAYVTKEQAEQLVKGCTVSSYITYYYNHFETNEFGKTPPLTIPEDEMVPLVKATALRDEHVMEVDMKKCRFVSDDIVRVTYGPFKGVVGRVARISRQNRVVFYIKGLQAGITTAYIPSYYLEKVEQDNEKR